MAELKTDEMVINMGPQHPSTHGVLRLELLLNGEIVENVKPYYEPFVQPSIQLDRHFIWCNFKVLPMNFEKDNQIKNINSKTEHYGFDLTKYKMKHRKDQVLRNCVNPDLGLYILEQALGVIRQSKFNQISLFGSM